MSGLPRAKKPRVESHPNLHSEADDAMLHSSSTSSRAQIILKKGSEESKVRRSVYELQELYENDGHSTSTPLYDLLEAWTHIKELPPTDGNSFFYIASLHGAPYRARTNVDSLSPEDQYVYWGGYCHHGNILFPCWHRVYCLMIERALQTKKSTVMLPYYDETDERALFDGLPWMLTRLEIPFVDDKGHQIIVKNPLLSYKFQTDVDAYNPTINPNTKNVMENVDVNELYSKPAGYETVRFPLSGIVAPQYAQLTAAHNHHYQDYNQCVELLNANVVKFLNVGRPRPKPVPTVPIKTKFEKCLDAENYIIFSNTSSAAAWNVSRQGLSTDVVSLESPHNDVHVAIGGFDMHNTIHGANADMGENETAAFDPIFFFHHCNIDRMFWIWQYSHGKFGFKESNDFQARKAEVDSYSGISYPGTRSADMQGPTTGLSPMAQLDYTTPLKPFYKNFDTYYTANDIFDITSLGYAYSIGSLDPRDGPPALRLRDVPAVKENSIHISGINRSIITGSVVLVLLAIKDDEETVIGLESILSRYKVNRCANCRTHLEAGAQISIPREWEEVAMKGDYSLEVRVLGRSPSEIEPLNKDLTRALRRALRPRGHRILGNSEDDHMPRESSHHLTLSWMTR